MSKKLAPLALKDADRVTLTAIADGSTPAESKTVKRAKALLMLSEGDQIKSVAASLSMGETSVSDLRKRYQEHGIGCLEDRPRSGRPVKEGNIGYNEVDSRIDGFIEKYKAEHDGARPNVKTIAAELNATKSTVKAVLHAKSDSRKNAHSWAFVSEGDFSGMEIIGLYLSDSRQVMVVKTDGTGIRSAQKADDAASGAEKSTTVSFQSAVMRKQCEQLKDALSSFSLAEHSSGEAKQEECLSFILSVIAKNKTEGSVIHVLACGEKPLVDPKGDQSALQTFALEETNDPELWITRTEKLLSFVGASDRDVELRMNLLNCIENYIRRARAATRAFTWTNGAAGKTASSRASRKNDSPAPGTIRVTMQIMGDDGKWIERVVEADMHIRLDQFDASSAGSYMKSASVVEQAIADVSHEGSRAIEQAYMNEAAKKNGSSAKS